MKYFPHFLLTALLVFLALFLPTVLAGLNGNFENIASTLVKMLLTAFGVLLLIGLIGFVANFFPTDPYGKTSQWIKSWVEAAIGIGFLGALTLGTAMATHSPQVFQIPWFIAIWVSACTTYLLFWIFRVIIRRSGKLVIRVSASYSEPPDQPIDMFLAASLAYVGPFLVLWNSPQILFWHVTFYSLMIMSWVVASYVRHQRIEQTVGPKRRILGD